MSCRTTDLLAACLMLPVAVAPAADPEKPPRVDVARPVERAVTDYEDFTGRMEAASTVNVCARVSGYLLKAPFKEGGEVKKGDLLFEIDPRPYQAEADRARATIALAEARVKLAGANYERARALAAKGAASKEELDKAAGERDVTRAELTVARANLRVARLNLDFCSVRSPIAGRISRRYLDPGNLAKADDTILTTIVTRDPMYVYFDIDERTFLDMRRAERDKAETAKVPVLMGLADEKGYPRRGTLDFADIRVDPARGTVRMRAVFANPDWVLVPGLFVRVRLPLGKPYKALLVPDGAVASDKGQKFVYVVNDKNVIERQRVAVGGLSGGLRVVREGLKPGDRVVVTGLNRLRAGQKVQPHLTTIAEASPPPAKK